MFWFFGQGTRRTLGPWLEAKPVPPALEEVLTTGPPGKSLSIHTVNE